jgi:PHD/YefM family antitoxin component YafN of YafNO toxin-antitoxin module
MPGAPGRGFGTWWSRVGLFRFFKERAILRAPNKVLAVEGRMLDITTDIQSLTTFRRSSGEFIKHLKKSKRPMVLTVNGKAAAVVQDAGAYQRLLDIAAQADAGEGIRQGLDDARRGKLRPARGFFAEFEATHGLSR